MIPICSVARGSIAIDMPDDEIGGRPQEPCRRLFPAASGGGQHRRAGGSAPTVAGGDIYYDAPSNFLPGAVSGGAQTVGGEIPDPTAAGEDIYHDAPSSFPPLAVSGRAQSVDAESIGMWAYRHARNMGVIAARNTPSVLLTTGLREAVRRYALGPLCAWSPAVANSLSGASMALPIGFHVLGIVRDYRNQTATRVTLGSRVAHIGMVAATGAVLAGVGGFAAAAPALAATNFIYTPLRDAVQYGIALRERTAVAERSTEKATLTTAPVYGFNQFLVSEAMDGLSGVLQDGLGLAAHIVARAPVNLAGETADDFFFRNARASSEGVPLEVDLTLRPYHASAENPGFEQGRTAALDQLLNAHAGRSSLLASMISVGTAADKLGLNSHAGNALVGLTAAVAYAPFIGAALQQSPAPEQEPGIVFASY